MVAAAMAEPKAPATVAVELCARMMDAGMLKDDYANYGVNLMRATGPQYVSDVHAVLADYLGIGMAIPSDVFRAFCRLMVMGDGNCPYCGGELEEMTPEGHELNDGTYLTPNSYIVDKYVYHCPICGETIKLDYEL